jgi:hypothetical protein
MYPAVPEQVAKAAMRGVILHLLKLQHDGRVRAILPSEDTIAVEKVAAIKNTLEMTRLTMEGIFLIYQLQWQTLPNNNNNNNIINE